MSVGFGFSIGDFICQLLDSPLLEPQSSLTFATDIIAAVELVATVVDALRGSGESSTEFRALVTQLHTLQAALESVGQLSTYSSSTAVDKRQLCLNSPQLTNE
ncbi:hypothetical protein L207DRAFT_580639 [Hyaloscypha variabilis F]|uniref:Fungal N-terminal domain-containing protein n=1 Tax=Hyaloscypha variabilis (strain UAMH 11265 / GT02V1 / F) TaxID=1149755 RepID=A0A2J6RZ75_HYAVF|nr:hypothetical protein L207DRAFT_580639 [Hyaloscypha variabilis F]